MQNQKPNQNKNKQKKTQNTPSKQTNQSTHKYKGI